MVLVGHTYARSTLAQSYRIAWRFRRKLGYINSCSVNIKCYFQDSWTNIWQKINVQHYYLGIPRLNCDRVFRWLRCSNLGRRVTFKPALPLLAVQAVNSVHYYCWQYRLLTACTTTADSIGCWQPALLLQTVQAVGSLHHYYWQYRLLTADLCRKVTLETFWQIKRVTAWEVTDW